MTRYIFGRDAADDLDQIWDYIAQDNVSAADRLINKLFDAFTELAKKSRIGTHATRSYNCRRTLLASRQLPDHLSHGFEIQNRDCWNRPGKSRHSHILELKKELNQHQRGLTQPTVSR